MSEISRPPSLDISVLIATQNHAAMLAQTLEAFDRQALGKLTWEVIVVDNGSSDETPAVLSAAATMLPIVVLEEPIPGKNRALNRGVSIARGRLLVFTDDDVVPANGWLATLHAAASRWPDESVFGGKVIPRFPPSTPEWLTRDDFPHAAWAFAKYCPRANEGLTGIPPFGPNLALCAHIFEDTSYSETIGPAGSSYAMGSETELLLRLYDQGKQFVFVPGAAVEHIIRDEHVTRRSLMRRAYRFGRGEARLSPDVGHLPAFGIPVLALLAFGSAAIRVAVSPLRGQSARWLAAMDFQRWRGHVWERRALLREATRDLEGSSAVRRFPHWTAVWSILRWRGIFPLPALALLRSLRPMLRLTPGVMFATALPKDGRSSPAPPGIAVEVLRGEAVGRRARATLCPLGIMPPEEIETRLRRGDQVAIAFSRSAAVGYAWCSFAAVWIADVDLWCIPAPTDVVGYDAYVLPAWRGHRILRALDDALAKGARRQGRERRVVGVNRFNRPAVRALTRMSGRRITTLLCIRRRAKARLLRSDSRTSTAAIFLSPDRAEPDASN